mgnify:CR=1 FL=1
MSCGCVGLLLEEEEEEEERKAAAEDGEEGDCGEVLLLLGRFFSLDPTPEPRLVGVPRPRLERSSLAFFFAEEVVAEEVVVAVVVEEEEEEDSVIGYRLISCRISSRIFEGCLMSWCCSKSKLKLAGQMGSRSG